MSDQDELDDVFSVETLAQALVGIPFTEGVPIQEDESDLIVDNYAGPINRRLAFETAELFGAEGAAMLVRFAKAVKEYATIGGENLNPSETQHSRISLEDLVDGRVANKIEEIKKAFPALDDVFTSPNDTKENTDDVV